MHLLSLRKNANSRKCNWLWVLLMPRQERLTILRAATHETELGDHGFCFSRSHYTDTDPTSRERAATAGIEPGSSSPGVARSTAELPRPPHGHRDEKKMLPNQ